MRGGSMGVKAYARPRRASAAGLALLAGAAALAGAARADDAGEGTQVSTVVVTAKGALGDRLGLSVLPGAVRDTPQAVSLIPAEQLKNQGVSTLEQALRNVPGITIAIGEGGTLSGDQFKIRGFDAKDDVYLDGLRDFGVYTRDSFDDEEVQVLKGPSGALFGRGTTGGAINVVSKAPRLEDFAEVDGYAGNGPYLRALADINRRLGPTSAVRLNLMTSSTGVVDRDLITSHRWGAALAAGVGLGTAAQATLSWMHQQDRRRPDYGVDIVAQPGQIVALPVTEYGVGVPRSAFLGFRNDLDHSVADMVTLRLKDQLSPRLTLTSDTRYGAYSRYFAYTSQDQCNAACIAALFDGDPATEPLGGIGGGGPYDMRAWGLQNISTIRYAGPMLGLRSEARLGIDVSKEVNDKQFSAYTLPAGITARNALPHPLVHTDSAFPAGYSVFRPSPGANIACPATGACTSGVLGQVLATNVTAASVLRSHGESADFGGFASERLWLSDSLSLIGTLRLDAYDARLASVLETGAAAPPVASRDLLRSPRASLVWQPAPEQTWYISWGRSQTPQGTSIVSAATALTVSARDLAPETGEVLEAGVKARVPGTRLLATISVFRIGKANALQVDPASGFLQAQSGERQKVKGLELGLTGRLRPAWTISAAYSYLDDRILESYANCAVATSAGGAPTNIVCPTGVTAPTPVLNTVAVGRQATFTPRHAASLYTTYDLGRGVQVGGDLVWQSRLFLAYTARSVSYAEPASLTAARISEAPQSLTFDAFASWTHGRWRLALNAYNLTDRLNYSQVFGNRAVPAPGRTLIVSVSARY